jgi:hypothetical protein
MLALGLGVPMVSAAVACGVFALGDVVPYPDAGAEEGAGDGAVLDDAPGDVGIDAACASDGNACACLSAPSPLALASDLGKAIAVVGQTVYFMREIETGGPHYEILSVPSGGLSDGASPTVVMKSTSTVAPRMLIVGDSIFMPRNGSASPSSPPSIVRVSTSGTSQDPTPFFGPLSQPVIDFGTDSALLYWLNADAVCGVPIDGAAPLPDPADSGCGSRPVVSDASTTGSSGLEVTSTELFWSSGSKLYEAPRTGVIVTRLTASGPIFGLTESQGQLFWFSDVNDAGAIWTAPDDAGDASLVVTRTILVAPAFSVDSDGIYFGEANGNFINAAGRDGSNRHVLACDEEGAAALASDQAYVYWVTRDGAVKRAAKR